MPRAPRFQYAGATYHITARGVNKTRIYRDDVDRLNFCSAIGILVGRRGWLLKSYCLLSTHFHLLVQIRKADMAVGMQWLNGTYARGFNERHGRTGHLLQGRYTSRFVQSEAHLSECFGYIALNPVKARLCEDPADWAWSSYGSLIGATSAPPFLAVNEALSHF